MVIVRPITLEDLDPVVALASQAPIGLTTLPQDREILQTRILSSQHSFRQMPQKPGGEHYLFVLEDLETGKVVGTSGMVSRVGLTEPFYTYQIRTSFHESKRLKVCKEVKTLHLVTGQNGPCEIGSLFLLPEHRKRGYGRLLSLARFLFMAEHRESFDPLVIAEMRGIMDEKGRSPFWEAVGRHFFGIPFSEADYWSIKNKELIVELLPTHPIYIALLPEEAQNVIGQAHEETRPAIAILQDEGFTFSERVDIFDAGPVFHCRLDEIRTVRESREATVREIVKEDWGSGSFIMANVSPHFRVCRGPIAVIPDGGVRITRPIAHALHVKEGDLVRYAALSNAGRES